MDLLSIAAFRDDAGRPVVMTVVQETEEEMARDVASGKMNHEYPPMGGSPRLVKAAAQLVLGRDCERLAADQVSSPSMSSHPCGLTTGLFSGPRCTSRVWNGRASLGC